MKKRFKSIHSNENIFSGFVDVMSNLLIIMLFLLVVFVISQFFLQIQLSKTTLFLEQETGKNKQLITNLSDIKKEKNILNKRKEILETDILQLNDMIKLQESRYDKISKKLLETTSKYTKVKANNKELNALILELEGKIIDKDDEIKNQLQAKQKLENNINELKEEFKKLNAALEASEELVRSKDIEIAEYSRKLNRALANKTAELNKFRSKFFEKLIDILKDKNNFKVVDDRFIFQSEVLFPSGSAEINNKGKIKLFDLSNILQGISKEIPEGINWVLRVDGHTDNIPINTKKYSSNWELSTARSISVVNYLIKTGLNPKHLVAAGFAEYHPITHNKTIKARKQNRRIEFKLDQK